MMSKKLVFLYFGCVISLLTLVLIFFVAIDPYGVFGYHVFQNNKWKPAQVNKTRYAKALAVLHKQPNAIILGNSRTEYGLDPKHQYFEGLNSYNLSFSSQSIFESFRYLVHANNVNKLKKVLIAIDFDSFNVATQSGFSQDYLCDEIKSCIPYVRLLKEIVSFEYLTTVTDTISNSKITRFIHLDNGMRDPEHNNFFIEKEGGYRNAFQIFEKHVINKFSGGAARVNKQALDTLKEMINYLHDNKIDTVLMFSPAHVRKWELLDATKKKGFEVWLEWKKTIMELNLDVAQKLNRLPFKVWDFSTFNSFTMESLPQAESVQQKMHYHWDTSHYKKELGDLALNTISGKSQEIGVLLTPDNIEEHLELLKYKRSMWVKDNLNSHDFESKRFMADKKILQKTKNIPLEF